MIIRSKALLFSFLHEVDFAKQKTEGVNQLPQSPCGDSSLEEGAYPASLLREVDFAKQKTV